MVRTSIFLPSILLGLACAAPIAPKSSGRGDPVGAPTTQSIGAAGGSLVAGALTITVPPGAVTQNTTLTVTPISATAPGHRGQALRLEPEGTTFSQPLTLTFRYEDADLVGTSAEALLIAFQHRSGIWAVPSAVTVDASARTVSVQTTHFSDWSMVAGAQLRPPSASVKVNDSLALVARRCFALPQSPSKVDDELAPLLVGFPCDDDPEVAALPVETSEWSVNGAVGGSATVGKVTGTLGNGTFVAPSSVPSPNSVAVSARVNLASKGKVLVVSNLTITDGATRVVVRAEYAKTRQTLTAFITGDVKDEGFEFELPFPVADGEVAVRNIGAGTVSTVRDSRAGCLQPTLGAMWDQLKATKVTVTGSFLTIEGEKSVPPITLGVGEGDCANTPRTEAARAVAEALQVGIPPELLTESRPPATALTTTQEGWTFTFRSQR